MWSTDIASPSFFGSKLANAQELARNVVGAAGETAPRHENVVPLHRRVAPDPQSATSGPRTADRSTGLTTALRWLGIAICTALCLPVFLFSLFLFGFVLLPLLPLIGVSLIASTGGSPTAPPARPRLPSAAAAMPPFPQAQAA